MPLPTEGATGPLAYLDKRTYRRQSLENMAEKYDYDLIVVGSGSGGLSAAKTARDLGKRVAIAEKQHVGGTCVNRGCIPTKLMVYAAEFAISAQIESDYGWSVQQREFDWSKFRQAMNSHVQSIRKSQIEGLEGIDLLRGQAEFTDEHTMSIDGNSISGEFVLLSVGARPKMPDLPGIEYALDSRDVFDLETLPKLLTIVGGGYIGVELAQVFHYYGCKVKIVDSKPHVLDGFDEQLQKRVRKTLEDDGIKVVDGARLKEIEKTDDGFSVTLDNDTTEEATQVICALGREANIDTLNLDAVSVTTNKGKIVVDEYKRTEADNIFAVGDCTDTVLLTPVAIAEGEAAVKTMFGNAQKVDYRWIPSAVYIHPEVASVGPTEEEAKEQNIRFETRCTSFTPLKYGMAESKSIEAFIKLLVNPDTKEIISLHLLAPRAADMTQMLVPALKKGLTLEELQETIPVHPSTGEELFCIE